MGFSVRIHYPGDDPEGFRIISRSNWTGEGIVFPRAVFSEARLAIQLQRPGVYVLLGPGDAGPSDLPHVYVGEGDPILPRLEEHARTKDFWTLAAAFTSTNQGLNKAAVQYLEARLLELAMDAKRCTLDNSITPQQPSLSWADADDAEGFLGDILLCLPVVGVRVFEPITTGRPNERLLYVKGRGVEAAGVDAPEGFIVRKGSQAAKQETLSIQPYVKALRVELLRIGVLEDAGMSLKFTRDYTFQSPSTAAGVVLGKSANGRTEWKNDVGQTLKEVQ